MHGTSLDLRKGLHIDFDEALFRVHILKTITIIYLYRNTLRMACHPRAIAFNYIVKINLSPSYTYMLRYLII